MASILYGSLVSDLAGKVGGQNFQRGLASPVLRNISTKRNYLSVTPVGNKITAIRGLFAYVTKQWRNLSPTEQGNWAAVTGSFPRVNKFGTSYTPSAYQLFVELSLGLKYVGLDIIAGAPSVSSFVATGYSVVYNSAIPSIVVTQSAPHTSSPYKTVIYASPFISNGRGYPRSGYRVLALFQFTSSVPTLDITSVVTNAYGAIQAGMQMVFGFSQINVTTGEESERGFYGVNF
jgi:hypothetical protein